MQNAALIFDLDGTLVDSLDDITDALNAALDEVGAPLVARDSVRGWVGDGLPTLCARALPNATPESAAQLVNIAKKHYAQHYAVRTRPYPNILRMLDLLKQRDCVMAVLSNKPHDLTVRVIDDLGMRDYFVDVRGYVAEEDKKPSPIVAVQIAKGMGILPIHVTVIGDSAVDISTARAAGMTAAAVSWGFRKKNELLDAKPDIFFDDPLEIAAHWARIG